MGGVESESASLSKVSSLCAAIFSKSKAKLDKREMGLKLLE